MSATSLAAVRTIADLRARVREWRAAGQRIGFAPTMGALHEGHLSLVRAARQRCDRVVVSIFVNPTQFGPNEDFDAYPRNEAADLALLAGVSADLAYLPSVEVMYPKGACTTVTVTGITDGLCGAMRPGHFQGVATVVTKLLLQVLPDAAFFGEKDYQQLKTITRMARDLDIPCEIIGVPTVREADGLALSSRNVYLSPAERRNALTLPRTMQAVAARLRNGSASAAHLAWGREELLRGGFDSVDYLELCDAEDLSPIGNLRQAPARLIAAARIGKTRLIDNIPVPF
ncbi:MAG: pantoate--beta-alanine ligase [Pseudomonadota bacterium]|jgi:pantoate--beta-alanine ligase|nr:pantoate--beta-alanine ligase [Alphaproteobacteria bacterium]